jgi:hypothetical protein
MLMYIQYKKPISSNILITAHAIEGHCVAGGAERISW